MRFPTLDEALFSAKSATLTLCPFHPDSVKDEKISAPSCAVRILNLSNRDLHALPTPSCALHLYPDLFLTANAT
jgi:hypothetical protein